MTSKSAQQLESPILIASIHAEQTPCPDVYVTLSWSKMSEQETCLESLASLVLHVCSLVCPWCGEKCDTSRQFVSAVFRSPLLDGPSHYKAVLYMSLVIMIRRAVFHYVLVLATTTASIASVQLRHGETRTGIILHRKARRRRKSCYWSWEP